MCGSARLKSSCVYHGRSRLPFTACISAAQMAPHLTPTELDLITALAAKKHSASEILEKIKKQRQRERLDPPKIWAVRRALAGATHLRGRPETRGRPRKLSPAQTQRMFKKRAELILQADGEQYVTVEETVRRARVPHVHVSTATRYLAQLGVKWRRMREKPHAQLPTKKIARRCAGGGGGNLPPPGLKWWV